jgi:protein phosphatase
MKIRISSLTDVGKERTNNEDTFAYCFDVSSCQWDVCNKDYVPLGSLGAVSIVADGMGGANAGEVASEIAITCLKESFQGSSVLASLKEEAEIHDFLTSSIDKANDAILRHLETDPDSFGMGTTLVVTWVWKEKIHIAWCGDSRCYRFNPNSGLEKLTKDHSFVQELIDKKEIREEDAINHPDSNLITRCLGDVDASSVPDVKTFKINDGDVFLLCSDGLCGYCPDEVIEDVMYKYFKDTAMCTDELVKLALDYGGFDNITVSVVSTLPDNESEPHLSLRGKLHKWFHV